MSEGATDSIVLWPLIIGILGDEGVVLNPVQPPSEPGAPAGWRLVFAALRSRRVSEALTFNDWVVVHIDTDVCEEPGFDVSRREGDRERTHEELAIAVQGRLRDCLNEHDPAADLARVAFAVAVNATECWLLLHLDAQTDRTKAASKRRTESSGDRIDERWSRSTTDPAPTVTPRETSASRRSWRRWTAVLPASTGSWPRSGHSHVTTLRPKTNG